MPTPMAIRATPNATTEVNSDAWRNDAVIAVSRSGSSCSSSAYVLPPVASSAWWLMMSAWQYAEIGPLTSSPAAQLASSDTVMFWSSSVVATTTQTTTPAIAMTIPTMMAVRDAILFIPALRPADRFDRRHISP